MIDSLKDSDNLSFVLPYDYIKDNQLIITSNDPVEVMTPNNVSKEMYHELQRYLRTSFSIKKCSYAQFNDYITYNYSSDNISSDISE